jgi:hypothetical protein
MTISDMILSKPDPVWKIGCGECVKKDARINDLVEVLDTLIFFAPEGWPQPLGWNQVVAQAKAVIKQGGGI